jgi:seryl-tRNA synthetase
VIDIKAFRNDPQSFIQRLKRKGADGPAIKLLNADTAWRAALQNTEELRSEQRALGKPETPEEIGSAKRIKEQLRFNEEQLAKAADIRDELLKQIPNPPDDSAPDGDTDEDAEEIRRWGEPPALTDPKEHTEIGRFDMERAARLSGARFGFMIGDTALLALALYRYAIDAVTQAGFLPVIPPVLVREEAMYGTGFFPTDRSNIYAVESDNLYLTGTSEVALAGLHMGEILEELPLYYAGYSTNFRREAGAAGKDTRGMFRVHQFNKVEMFVYCEPGKSADEHERILAIEEQILQGLEIPYRVVNVAAGDLGAPAVKKYDCEGWFPAQERYRELTSTSNTTDFQARRLGIRYRDGKSLATPHTLNGTAITDRALLALLENFQGEVPDVLRPFGAPPAVGR